MTPKRTSAALHAKTQCYQVGRLQPAMQRQGSRLTPDIVKDTTYRHKRSLTRCITQTTVAVAKAHLIDTNLSANSDVSSRIVIDVGAKG